MALISEINLRDFASGVGTVIEYAAGNTVCREEDEPRYMHIVLHGAVEIVAQNNLLETFGEGKAFGILSLLDGLPRTVTARIGAPARVVVIDRKKFRYMIEEMPQFCWYVTGELAHRLRATNAAL
ncbi:MAG: hypothetical protein B7X08_07025 [Acidocella sp. 20-63-7]|nr:MAG: hypothetical protein B7X08_07025 [Acidocella sp. 20-63-7]